MIHEFDHNMKIARGTMISRSDLILRCKFIDSMIISSQSYNVSEYGKKLYRTLRTGIADWKIKDDVKIMRIVEITFLRLLTDWSVIRISILLSYRSSKEKLQWMKNDKRYISDPYDIFKAEMIRGVENTDRSVYFVNLMIFEDLRTVENIKKRKKDA